jgi:hypothetical protein
MANELSNKYKFELCSGNIDFDLNTFKIILMATAFTFNKDTHENYDDVSANELAAGNGYTTGGNTLAGVSVTEDDANDRCSVTWNNSVWNASGGDIGPSPGAIIYKDTGTPATSTVIGFIDFTTDQTATDGGTFTVSNIEVRQT